MADHACIRSLSQLAQRGPSRSLNTPPQGLTNADAPEHMAAGQLETDSQTNSWDPELISRASSVAFPEDVPPGSKAARSKEKGKGKIKEKDGDKMVTRVKEEPLPAALPLFNNISSAVTAFTSHFLWHSHSGSEMRIIARRVVLWGPWSTAMAALGHITFGVLIRQWRRQTFRRGRAGGFVPAAKFTR